MDKRKKLKVIRTLGPKSELIGRSCLKCDKPFRSTTKYKRLCDACTISASNLGMDEHTHYYVKES